jgi:hypothetical protein
LYWLYKKANYLNLTEVQKLCAATIVQKRIVAHVVLPRELQEEVKQLVTEDVPNLKFFKLRLCCAFSFLLHEKDTCSSSTI